MQTLVLRIPDDLAREPDAEGEGVGEQPLISFSVTAFLLSLAAVPPL